MSSTMPAHAYEAKPRHIQAIMGIFSRFYSKPLRAEVEKSIRAAGIIIGVRLIAKYTPQHGHSKATALGAAVTNELFGAPPGNETGRQFLAENKELVETHLRALKTEGPICRIVSMLTHTKCNIAGNTGVFSPEMLRWVAKLREVGILLPVEEVTLPTSLDEMRQQIREFELWSMRNPA
jgi:hypothetical protein